jgi:hypothetical protein
MLRRTRDPTRGGRSTAPRSRGTGPAGVGSRPGGRSERDRPGAERRVSEPHPLVRRGKRALPNVALGGRQQLGSPFEDSAPENEEVRVERVDDADQRCAKVLRGLADQPLRYCSLSK